MSINKLPKDIQLLPMDDSSSNKAIEAVTALTKLGFERINRHYTHEVTFVNKENPEEVIVLCMGKTTYYIKKLNSPRCCFVSDELHNAITLLRDAWYDLAPKVI